ncbi:hypothetical protein MMYC01_208888 [Madurella mycetomatis]|uniref:Uncharacterized protein n=1 Tax=Madurella mycetomatis TaxID=100816 RepID=A0A175VTD2_9PEZI|nr:hypothetical protein MMYC01_208888 [Madurella mycetomatis]
MLDNFSLAHIPAFIVASTTTFGGIWPMFNAPAAMLEFGFPPTIAQAPAAAPVMVNGQARTTILGLLTFIFYYQGKYSEVDTILAVFGVYAGAVDAYLVWKLGNPGKGVFRLVASWAIAACGFARLTSR